MKKAVRFAFLLAFALMQFPLMAQTFGLEYPVPKKNFYIGFKGGVNALDINYTIDEMKFRSPSVFYQKDALERVLMSCTMAGLSFERSIPNLSYGVELVVHGLNTEHLPNDTIPYFQDSAYYASIRVPVRLRFFEDRMFSPYIYAAPSIGTYISDTIFGAPVFATSNWNGRQIQWGTKNTRDIDFSVIAGAGVDAKIQIGLYEIKVRAEAGYRIGLLDMKPKPQKNSNNPTTPAEQKISRKMQGWEATIGIVFPLLTNPHYSWLM